MSVVQRLETVREREKLNKSQFEKRLSKSTGYLNMLTKRDSNPGVDVLATFSKEFPHYCLEWVLTGEGKMLKYEQVAEEENLSRPDVSDYNLDLSTVRDEIRGDLKAMMEGMTENFKTVSDGIFHVLKDTQKLTKFIDKLDVKGLKDAGKDLRELVKERK